MSQYCYELYNCNISGCFSSSTLFMYAISQVKSMHLWYQTTRVTLIGWWDGCWLRQVFKHIIKLSKHKTSKFNLIHLYSYTLCKNLGHKGLVHIFSSSADLAYLWQRSGCLGSTLAVMKKSSKMLPVCNLPNISSIFRPLEVKVVC